MADPEKRFLQRLAENEVEQERRERGVWLVSCCLAVFRGFHRSLERDTQEYPPSSHLPRGPYGVRSRWSDRITCAELSPPLV